MNDSRSKGQRRFRLFDSDWHLIIRFSFLTPPMLLILMWVILKKIGGLKMYSHRIPAACYKEADSMRRRKRISLLDDENDQM